MPGLPRRRALAFALCVVMAPATAGELPAAAADLAEVAGAGGVLPVVGGADLASVPAAASTDEPGTAGRGAGQAEAAVAGAAVASDAAAAAALPEPSRSPAPTVPGSLPPAPGPAGTMALPAPEAPLGEAPPEATLAQPPSLPAVPGPVVAEATPPGNVAPAVSPPYAPSDAPFTPARSKAEFEAERILFPGLAGPPEDGDHYGPPRLLSPGTRPYTRDRPLVLAPSLSTRVPIPGAGAGNCVRRDERGRFMGWMDRQQCVFSGRAMVTARWVDDFFGDWHDDEATMMARLRSHTVLTESEGLQTRFSLHARAELPNAQRRLRLIISDESDETPSGQDLRRQIGEEDSRVSAALRWVALDRGGLVSNFDVGARGFNPMDIFARYRLGKTWSLSDDSLVRLSQTLRYGSDTKERYTPVLDFERALDERSVLRFSNYYDYRHENASEGFAWTHGVSFSKSLRNSRSYSYGLSMNGLTQPQWRSESVGPWFIYRRAFLRPWLYLEVEPHYTWYRDRDWEGLASLIVRLEMQFGWKSD